MSRTLLKNFENSYRLHIIFLLTIQQKFHYIFAKLYKFLQCCGIYTCIKYIDTCFYLYQTGPMDLKTKSTIQESRGLHGINAKNMLIVFRNSSLRFLRGRRYHFIGESALRHKANGYQRQIEHFTLVFLVKHHGGRLCLKHNGRITLAHTYAL